MALLLLRVAALVGVLSSGQELDGSILGGDARRYGEMVSAKGTPYADFAVEYPPLVLGTIKLVYTEGQPYQTLVKLGVSQFALDLGIAGLLRWAFGRRVLLAYLLLGLAFLPFPLHYMRLDLLSVFLATAGWAFLRKHLDVAGGAALGLSVFAKLWPLALAPLMLIEHRRRALVSWVVTGAVGAIAWWMWAGPSGMVQVVSFRGATGWQVESLPGIVLHMIAPERTNFAQGAWRTGTMPSWSRALFTLLSVGLTALAWWWVRSPATPDGDEVATTADVDHAVGREPHAPRDDRPSAEVARYGLAAVVAVTAFLVFSSIISPQYVLWLAPYCAVATAWRPRRYALPSVAIFALSTLGLAVIHGQPDGHLYATLPILLRNVALVWLLVVALVDLRPPPETTARDERPDPGDTIRAADGASGRVRASSSA